MPAGLWLERAGLRPHSGVASMPTRFLLERLRLCAIAHGRGPSARCGPAPGRHRPVPVGLAPQMVTQNAAALCVIGALVAGCSGSSTTTPTAAVVPYETATSCCGWDTQASGGQPAQLTVAAQGFKFTFPAGPSSIHQLVAPQNARALNQGQTITAQFQITGSNPVFIETDPCTTTAGPGLVRLYFQQTGDTWSGAGAYANYRWWSGPLQLAVGKFTLSATLNSNLNSWTNVYGQTSSAQAAGFLAAIANIQAFGLAFGGCFGSHGAQLKSGSAQFNLMSYVAQ